MTLRTFVSMIFLAGVFTPAVSALAADAGNRATTQAGDTQSAGNGLGVCCQQDRCVPNVTDQALCEIEIQGTWHPRADCTVCGCTNLAPAGDDCWHTVCGATQYDFSDLPLPADFFGVGSQPFRGAVKLGSPTPFAPDTFIRRLGDMCFDGALPVATEIPVELVALNLVGCQPIVVMFDTGPSEWNVTVALDDFGDRVRQSEGRILVQKTDDSGGKFDSVLPVRPKFVFQDVRTGRTVETGPRQIPETTLEALGVRWWQFQPPFEACGQGGFSPGEFDPNGECCPETCHSSFGAAPHEHCVIPPGCRPCVTVQTGACCDRRIADPVDRCVDNVLETECVIDDPNQVSWFENTPCSQIACREHIGACCDGTTGECQDNVPESACPVNSTDPTTQFSWFKDTQCTPVGGTPICFEHTGACCNDRTGVCENDVPESQCPTSTIASNPWRWTKGRTCDELVPPCGPRGACCVDGVCLGILTADACRAEDGRFFERRDCEACSTPPSEPCENCGLTEHWVDDPACPGGVDHLNLSGATFGLVFDLDPATGCTPDVSVRAHGPTFINFSGPVDDSSWFPGTRAEDNHLDVRDTEIVSMDLVSVNGDVRMTAGWGRGAIPLPHSYGAIAELPGDKALAHSFFDMFVEIEVLDGGGNVIARVYNRDPIVVEAEIDCIPPDVGYIHPDCLRNGPIPLFLSPFPDKDQPVLWLVDAEHRTFEQRGACCDGTTGICLDDQFEAQCPVNPDDPLNQFSWHKETLCENVGCREHTGACCDRRTQTCVENVPESQCRDPNDPDRFGWTKDTACDEVDPPCEPRGACCIDGECLGILSAEACHAEGGRWFENRGCEVCSTPPSVPCENCGLVEHWVDDPACPGGVDRLELSGAKFGLDFDVDTDECAADVNVRAHGPTWINFSGPRDESIRFLGLRPADGHLDVRDTEIVSMDLASPNGQIRMTAGWGRGAIPLPHSYGAIAELAGDKALAESFFEVLAEIEVRDAADNVLVRMYNREPVLVEATIDCIPPDANYIHPVGCIPLFTSPIAGEGIHIANLVSAEHRTFQAACFETIGGGVYTDCDSPLTSGEENVAITVGGPGGVFNAVTSGPSGVWSIPDVPCGEYTVAAVQVFREYCHVDIGGDCPPEPCVDSTVINVDPVNRAENLSIQFLGREDCIVNDMNYDEICTIVHDVDLFVQCVYDGDCVGPNGRDLKCPADCNCDDLTTIVFDVDCFVHDVFVKGVCGSCDDRTDAASRSKDGRRSSFTVGGAVYDDASNPLLSGVQDVTVRIYGSERRVVAIATTAGPSGIWRVDDLPEGEYTVAIERRNGRVAAGRDAIRITVNAENEAANLSIAVLRDTGPTRTRDGRRDQR